MIPLMLADVGKDLEIVKISGTPELKHHLEDIGFVVGDIIQVLSSQSGNVIVTVKGTRIAISNEMARKIMVKIAE